MSKRHKALFGNKSHTINATANYVLLENNYMNTYIKKQFLPLKVLNYEESLQQSC